MEEAAAIQRQTVQYLSPKRKEDEISIYTDALML